MPNGPNFIKNRVNRLLRKRGLTGNASGLSCNTESTGEEGRDCVQPSSLGGFTFIFLKAAVWAQAPLKASSGPDSFIVQVCV